MREVPSLLFGYMRELLADAGRDVDAALEGLSLQHVRPRLGYRVDWNELATFLNRATTGLSDEEMEAIGQGYVRVNRYLSAAFSLVTRPKAWYRLVWLASRHAFPHVHLQIDAEDEDELTLTMTLPGSYVGCPFFFSGTVGELKAMPRLLRLPDAVVSAEVTSHSGIYRVGLGASERSWVEQRPAPSDQRLVEDLLGVLPPEPHDDAGESQSLVYALQQRHGLTRAEARVAVRLAEGLSVADIARALHVSVETVRTHLKRAYGKLGVRRQAELVRAVLGLQHRQDA